LLELLENNGGCHLPCLWGITPEKSTYPEARAILEPLSSISSLTGFRADGGSISPTYAEGDLFLDTDVSFLSEEQIVNRVTFRAREMRNVTSPSGEAGFAGVFDSASFGERVGYFLLPHILSEQGMPEAVLISTDGGPERGRDVPGFYVLLFYPDQGLLVSYTTYRELAGANVRGCLSSAHVELELAPPGHGDSFSEYLSQTQWANLWPVPADSPHWKPIEKATSMSLDEFYETFRQATDQCIETPASIWPVPER
jgi:hypothetical protein